MSQPKEVIGQAAQDLDDLTALKRHPAFSGYFVRKVKEKVEAQKKRVLDGPHATPEALWEEWQRYRHILEYSGWMEQDEQGLKTLLNSTERELR